MIKLATSMKNFQHPNLMLPLSAKLKTKTQHVDTLAPDAAVWCDCRLLQIPFVWASANGTATNPAFKLALLPKTTMHPRKCVLTCHSCDSFRLASRTHLTQAATVIALRVRQQLTAKLSTCNHGTVPCRIVHMAVLAEYHVNLNSGHARQASERNTSWLRSCTREPIESDLESCPALRIAVYSMVAGCLHQILAIRDTIKYWQQKHLAV